MKVKIRKTTFDAEVGRMIPGMVVDVNKTTGERWIKYRIADEMAQEEPKVASAVIEKPRVTVVAEEEENPDFEVMTKAEIRAYAEQRGVFVPIKANKEEMLKRLSGAELK